MTKRKIVSSAHLVSEQSSEMSEFEFGLIVAANGFNRWITRCMAAAGQPEMSALEVMVLHSVNHRDRAKKLADLCFVLNIEDTHLVNYALKKLVKAGLVSGDKQGKEIFYTTSEEGEALCARYREVREDCLVSALGLLSGGKVGALNKELGETAELLRALSGLYDQAARSATSL